MTVEGWPVLLAMVPLRFLSIQARQVPCEITTCCDIIRLEGGRLEAAGETAKRAAVELRRDVFSNFAEKGSMPITCQCPRFK